MVMTGNHRDTFMPSGNGLPSLPKQPQIVDDGRRACRKFGSGGLPILPVGRSGQKNEIRIITTENFPHISQKFHKFLKHKTTNSSLNFQFCTKYDASVFTTGTNCVCQGVLFILQIFFILTTLDLLCISDLQSLTFSFEQISMKRCSMLMTCGMNCVMFCPGVSAASRRRY